MSAIGDFFAVGTGIEADAALRNWLRNVLAWCEWLDRRAHLAVPLDAERETALELARPDGSDRVASFAVFGGEDPLQQADDVRKRMEAVRAGGLILPHPARSEMEEPRSLRRALLESCGNPIVFLPASARLDPPLVSSLIVPLSGEIKESQALDQALRLAESKALPVEVVHVSSEECCGTPLDSIADQAELEYPARLDEAIAESSPFSTDRMRRHICCFHHCRGDIVEEIRRRVDESSRPLLVVEWSGSLEEGRARVARRLLAELDRPLLLVKSTLRPDVSLNVGRAFRPGRRQLPVPLSAQTLRASKRDPAERRQ
jgi:hypothetical protein